MNIASIKTNADQITLNRKVNVNDFSYVPWPTLEHHAALRQCNGLVKIVRNEKYGLTKLLRNTEKFNLETKTHLGVQCTKWLVH